MSFLEEGLRQLAGRPFKLFLRKQTSNKFKAIAGGATITGVVQSSSVVNLMVLAFVGAGVIQMQNALAVILGANLGTTFNSWIVATIGFRFNIESFAFPIAGVFGILMMLTNKESRWYQWSKLLFGFGFLFVGLNYMKTGIEDVVKQVDLGSLDQYPLIVFFLIGLLITSLIQSSAATIAIVLSALHVHAISLLAATAIVLGSEIGTTFKLVLASVKGIAAKKRVALGNLIFNIITALIVFIFLLPVNRFITEVVGIGDNLMALVFFQSLVNLTGIILFFPFLNLIGRFLERRFLTADNETTFINKVRPADTELALAAMEKESKHFIYQVAGLTLDAFDKNAEFPANLQLNKDFKQKSLMENYEYIKRLHGEMHKYAVQLQNYLTDTPMIGRLNQLISSSRNSMYAAKNVKDAYPDIEQLKKSSNDLKYDFYRQSSEMIKEFYERVVQLLMSNGQDLSFKELSAVYQLVQEGYARTLHELYKGGLVKNLSDTEFSTLLNFNREMYTSQKSIVFALKDLLLTEKEAAWFDELPGFIR